MLTPSQRDSIDIVLVRPRNPLNIGAVARAMANFGFSHLSIVSPYEEHWREARSAVGAPELLQHARETSTLAEAVAHCTLVLGTGTLTYRKAEQPVLQLPALTPLLDNALHTNYRTAIVFGSEKHGLTREDLSWCHHLIEIPTDPQQPSMNLGQAAAVCLYEIATHTRISPAKPAATDTATPSGELDRLATVIEEAMTAVGYSPAGMQQANHHDLRLLLRRLAPGPRDTRRILGLFRRILWRLHK